MLAVTGPSNVSVAWPSANRALFIPFVISRPWRATQAVVGCGTTAGGNFDVGIYDYAGNLLTSSGGIARAASSEVVAAFADVDLGEGLYYMAMAVSTTNTMMASAPAQAGLLKCCGVKEMASAYTLPSTATFATVSSAYLPHFTVWGTPT